MKHVELLAPAGNKEKMKAAFLYGADAVYLAGKQFGLRAFAGNFDEKEMAEAINFAHSQNKKVYIVINIFARNNDFKELITYVKTLEKLKADAVIVSDLGAISVIKENTNLEIHVSTQANILNKYTAMEYVKLGAKRVILARELSLTEIRDIAQHLKGKADVEVFVHGAMCISYSGRCLLSNYLAGRESNRGLCVQACRWKYSLIEERHPEDKLRIEEDERGTYIMNSKDLCLINHIEDLEKAGVTSFKIEGRMKSEYYVAGVVNTYRRAMDGEKFDYIKELEKISHRRFTTGFVFNEEIRQHYESSAPVQSHEFMATVISGDDNKAVIEQRNLFNAGDELEVLSPKENFNKTFIVGSMTNEDGETIEVAKRVQEKLVIKCPFKLYAGDILRKKINE